MRFALITRRPTPTNEALARVRLELGAWEQMTPEDALSELRPGDVALGRLDVLPTLDGIDDGLWALGALAARGVRVLNEPAALVAAHDKLLTARLLRRSGVPHPRTLHVREGRPIAVPGTPVVVKPRFGSWGRDVFRCDDMHQLHDTLAAVRSRDWYASHGALVQELVPPQGLGAVRKPVTDLPRDASEIALAASRAAGTTLVGVDLLPNGRGGWQVAELNGAVEFSSEYAPFGDVFTECATVLAQAVLRQPDTAPATRWAG